MISVTETAPHNFNNVVAESEPASAFKTVVICGSCGAQEQAIDEHKTECPHCDDYIY